MTHVQAGDIVRMRTDNDDMAYVAGIVGTVVENIKSEGTELNEYLIHATARQFSPHVSFAANPIVEDKPQLREIWACAHEFTIIN